LKDSIAIELSNYQRKDAIKSSIIDTSTNHKNGIYGFIGYPATKNGPKYAQKQMKNRPYLYYDKSLKTTDVSSFSYDDCLNILINYQHKKTIVNGVGPLKSTKMKGISGGPVFWVSSMKNLSNWNKLSIKLAGITIHTVEMYRYMAAVRIKTLIDAIDDNSQFQDEFDIFNIS
jgi:hypothetical protein